MTTTIEVTYDPPDLLERMARYPQELDEEMRTTAKKALYHLQGSVPEYPPPPAGSRYQRTGTLGRSLGLGGGAAEISQVARVGKGYEATLGTRLEYAPYVIGSAEDQPSQAAHMNHWWTTVTIAEKAEPGIERLYNASAERMAAFLDGQ